MSAGIAELTLPIDDTRSVSALLQLPRAAKACFVLAHGAGAGMDHLSMTAIAGGRSFGGRMTSQAQAIEPLPGVKGLAFIGFPLHPAGKPSVERAEHLRDLKLNLAFRVFLDFDFTGQWKRHGLRRCRLRLLRRSMSFLSI